MSDEINLSGAQTHEPPSETSDDVFGFQLNGHGSCVFSDGSKYVGEFEDGLFNGQGTHWYADGTRYEGGFCEGFFSGHGVFTSATGTKVEGEFGHGNFVGSFDRRMIAQITHGGLAATATGKGALRSFLRLALAKNVLIPSLFFAIGIGVGRCL